MLNLWQLRKIWFDSKRRSSLGYWGMESRDHLLSTDPVLNKNNILRYVIHRTASVKRSTWFIQCSAGNLMLGQFSRVYNHRYKTCFPQSDSIFVPWSSRTTFFWSDWLGNGESTFSVFDRLLYEKGWALFFEAILLANYIFSLYHWIRNCVLFGNANRIFKSLKF